MHGDDDAIYFPSVLNYEALYESKNIPLEYFFNITDSNELISKKKKFYSTYETSNWSLHELLIEFLHFQVLQLMSACVIVQEMSVEIQNRLNEHLPKKLPVISAFSKGTRTGFFYAILTNHTLAHREDIYTVMYPNKGKVLYILGWLS